MGFNLSKMAQSSTEYFSFDLDIFDFKFFFEYLRKNVIKLQDIEPVSHFLWLP